MPTITLEAAIESFDDIDIGLPLMNLSNLRNKVRALTGFDLDVITYFGLLSRHGGGRLTGVDYKTLASWFDLLNRKGIPVGIALNGGLTFASDEKLDYEELKTLTRLDDNAQYFEVDNLVVVTKDYLRREIRKRFHHLKIVSSCIQHLDPVNNGEIETYDRLFRDYDFVVPLNQHTTYDFLQRFSQHAEKMLALLNLACPKADTFRCYNDYVGVELELAEEVEDRSHIAGERVVIESPDYDGVPSMLPDESLKCFEDGKLIQRPNDVIRLLQMGVRHFKIPRRIKLEPHEFTTFLSCLRYCSETDQQLLNPDQTERYKTCLAYCRENLSFKKPYFSRN